MHFKRFYSGWLARGRPAVFLALLLALVLAACGDDEPEAAVPSSPAGSTSEQTANDMLAVGAPAPDFTLPSATGDDVSLADYRGEQPVLLFFHMAAG